MMMIIILIILVPSLPHQIAFGAEPLASISRPFHLNLPFRNTTTLIILRPQAQIHSYHNLSLHRWTSVVTPYVCTTPPTILLLQLQLVPH